MPSDRLDPSVVEYISLQKFSMSFTVDTTDNTQCVLKSWDLSEFLQLGHEETNPKWGWIESNVYNEGRAEKSDFDIGS